ncbi:helix-turn-helix transcriptional regulator [Streptomyces sp. NPDC096339]|uniref:helix-turn-helix transcriptional regulator n=1 Tax=Streptomyces sp. NPDC096339 TaxID=3366086 RepID=UPI00380EE3BE
MACAGEARCPVSGGSTAGPPQAHTWAPARAGRSPPGRVRSRAQDAPAPGSGRARGRLDQLDGLSRETGPAADMARAADVSVQSLREGFRRHLNTTPLAYLRSVRLALVRRDLVAVAEGRAPGNVTGVALRWGFTHLGRFTGYYRATYGETPSQTLRNARVSG